MRAAAKGTVCRGGVHHRTPGQGQDGKASPGCVYPPWAPGMWVTLPRKGLALSPAQLLCGWSQGKVSPISLCLCVCRKHGLWLPCCVWPNSPAGSALDLILGFTCSPWLGLGEKSIMASWAANDMFKPHSSLMLWALKHPYSTDGETEARGQFTWDQLRNSQVGEPGIWLGPL